MKKTKIILPAIALLAVSGVASVTGTVAWFTAASSSTINVNNIAAINVQGNLETKIKAGAGVSTKNNTSDGIAQAGSDYIAGTTLELEYLCDSSYDAIDKKLYTAIMDSDNLSGSTVAKAYREVTDWDSGKTYKKTGAAEASKVFYAATWTATFSTKASFGTYELFFDARTTGSKLTSSLEIAKAFRLAMITSTETIVWAPNEGTNTYVTEAGTTSTENTLTDEYAETVFLSGNNTTHFTSASTGTPTNDITHLGSVTSATSLDVTFVAWFEGTDATCIGDNANNVKDATLRNTFQLATSFYSVSFDA